jgi:hypothetical protein
MSKPEFSERAKRKYPTLTGWRDNPHVIHDSFTVHGAEEIEQVMMQGYADVDCTSCGHSARVEPDGDYPCEECGVGRLTSPLVAGGLI